MLTSVFPFQYLEIRRFTNFLSLLAKREGRRSMLKSKMSPSFSSSFIFEKQAVKSFHSAAQWNFLYYTVEVHTDSRKVKAVMSCRTVVVWLVRLVVRVPSTGDRVSYGLMGLFWFFNLEEENCRWGDKADNMNLLGHLEVPSNRGNIDGSQ